MINQILKLRDHDHVTILSSMLTNNFMNILKDHLNAIEYH